MEREFKAFVEEPSTERFLSARKALAARSPRTLSAGDFRELAHLLDERDLPGVSRALQSLPPIAALSPAVHLLAARAALLAGDEQDHALEEYLAEICLEALLGTGDGSIDRPYFVCCTRDEIEVCRAQNLQPAKNALLHIGGSAIDVIECDSGEFVCFDVSALVPLPAPQARRRRKDARPRDTAACRKSSKRPLTRTAR